MSRRKVLVIHESNTLRRILARSIEGELGDVDVTEAESPGEGIERLHDEAFSVVVCGNEMTEIDGVGVHSAMRAGHRNKKTPFLLMTSSPSPKTLKHLQAHGIDHVLSAPVPGKELARRIDAVCDPRESREHERQAFSDAGAVVHAPGGDIAVETVNLGAGGVLADFAYIEDFVTIFNASSMTLHFPAEYGLEPVTVGVQFLRLSVVGWRTPTEPETLRMAWRFVGISEDAREVLHKAIQCVAKSIENSERS